MIAFLLQMEPLSVRNDRHIVGVRDDHFPEDILQRCIFVKEQWFVQEATLLPLGILLREGVHRMKGLGAVDQVVVHVWQRLTVVVAFK